MASPKTIVAGVIGLDDLKTPFGKAKGVLGGPAVYAAMASRIFSRTGVISVVGTDFSNWKSLAGLDTSGISVKKGKTFRWVGEYSGAMNEARTIRTDLNVSDGFQPVLSDSYRRAPFLFLANADPAQQISMMEQSRAKFKALDTMNYWINHTRKNLLRAISMADCLIVNDGEARMLTGEASLVIASSRLLELGPKYVIVKKGEHGALLVGERSGHFFSPSYPVPKVIDPTGAGDSFGGALTGFLASKGKVTEPLLRQGIVWAGAVASYTVSGFGTRTIGRITRAQVAKRFAEFRKIVRF
jgi:sugar/nucleoside kinase (ribokinase family)